jgi:hypothetical protein
MRGTFQFIRPKVIHNGISVVARTRLFWAPKFRRPERRVTLIYATPRMPPDAAMLYTRPLNFLSPEVLIVEDEEDISKMLKGFFNRQEIMRCTRRQTASRL